MLLVRFAIWLPASVLMLLVVVSATTAKAQQLEITKLVHPDVADRLSLSEEQRVRLQQLVLERANALASAKSANEKEKIKQDYASRASEILSEAQREKLADDQPTQKLAFQFRDMKWEQILTWFADQQDLTLIMDRVPPGSFTYSDTRTYSPAEAIDLLNSVLLTRGFTLVRREKMLTVLELNDSLPVELIPSVELVNILERGKFELVNVTFPLAGRPVENVVAQVKPYLNSYGRVLPLANGSMIMVIENAGKMQTINELIASVPLPKKAAPPAEPVPPPKPVLASYPLGGLDSVSTLAFVRKLIPSENITVDDRARILSAFVIPDQQTAIQSALNTMQEKWVASASWQSVAYPLNKIAAAEFKAHIAAIAPQARVLTAVDQGLVVASLEDQEAIRKSLVSLQLEPVAGDRETRFLSVGKLEASVVEVGLKKFLPNCQVTANDAAGSVLVRGSRQEIDLATEVVAAWQKSAESKVAQLRSFTLGKKANAEWISTVAKIVPKAKTWLSEDGKELLLLSESQDISVIESLLPQLITLLPQSQERILKIYPITKTQKQRRSSLTSGLPAYLSELTVTEVSGGQELLVWGTELHHNQFSEFLKLIDQPTPQAVSNLPESFELKVQDTTTVLALLAAEYPEAKLTLSDDATRITALAESALQEKIRARVAQFNQVLPPRIEKQWVTYQVAGMTASQLQTALTGVLAKATVQVDAVHSRLLILANPSEHKSIAAMVELLNEKPSIDLQKVVVVYPLAHANATAVKTMLGQLDSEASVIADDKLKQVAVTATISKQAVIQSAVNQMDRPAAEASVPELRGFDVKSYQAALLLPALQSLWPDMKLSADTTSNKIIATGTARELEQFSQAIERLMSAPVGKQPVVRTYPVPFGDMTSLQAILSQIAPQSTVSSDAASRTVTVLASEEMQARVKQAIEQLLEAVGKAKRPASYTLKPTQLATAQTALIALYPGISTAIDSTTGQLVVVAGEQVQAQVASVIELLASGPNAADRTLQVFRLNPEQVELANFLTALQSLTPSQVKLELNLQTGTLVAIGSESDLAAVAKQVEILTEKLPATVQKSSKVYKLSHTTPASAVLILQALIPKATLVSDATSKTVSATASNDEHAKIAEFLKSFDLPATPKSYIVRPTQLTPVLTSLRTMFPTIEMSSDATTGQIIVVAVDTVQSQVEKIIELLRDGPNAVQRTVRAFALKRGLLDSPSFLASLKTLVSTQVTLDASLSSESLVAIGTEEELAQVELQVKLLESQLPTPSELSSAVYHVKHVSTVSAMTVLQPLVPKATLVQDAVSRTIAATAKPADHQKIAELLQLLDVQSSSGQRTKVYKLKRGSGRALSLVLREVMSDARMYGDSETGTFVATASAEQHESIQSIVNEYDSTKEVDTRVYSLGKADSRSLQAALQEFSSDAKISSDRATNSLIVTAPKELMTQIDQVVNQVDGSATDLKVTAFYPVYSADPISMAKSLLANFPKASLIGDSAGGGIFATATQSEHSEIRKLIEEVNNVPSKLPTMRAFKISNVRATEVANGLREAMGRRSESGITVHEPTNSVFVVGTRESLRVAEQIVQQLDSKEVNRADNIFRVLEVDDVDGEVAVQAIEAAFRNQPEPVEVRFDKQSDRLFVLAPAAQLQEVERVVNSLRPEPRDLQVVSVRGLDPYVAKEAIDALFYDLPYNRTPRITVDQGQQQLLIKATAEQQKQIVQLLDQMSASGRDSRLDGVGKTQLNKANGSSRIRLVPMHRNSQRVLDELQRVWPEVRGNQLKIMQPNENSRPGAQLVKPAGTSFVTTGSQPQEKTEEPAIPATQSVPPVMIVIGDDQWILASDDLVALEELQRVIELMRSQPVQPFLTSGNYSVYLLQRASASEVSQTLDSLLQTERSSSRTSSFSELARRTKIVPDPRTNALIVSGNPNDRKLIEELLGILDSDELIGSLQQLLPTTIPLTSANATQVETILKTIYKSQLATSSSRKPIQVPEGVSSEITVLLQQLNAESASPLLTMTSEETTNSIILRAPAELTEEIRNFVQSIDRQTSSTPSRRVDLIQLKSTNTESIGAALKRLLSK